MAEHTHDGGTHQRAHTHDGGTHHHGDQQGRLNLHEDADNAVDMWDGMYRERPKIWSGNPNPQLVLEVGNLEPGTALDLGCGEGGDAIWLAKQGWQVTAMDVSAVALDRGAAHAAENGQQDRITWQQQDLADWTPEPEYHLVSAQFLHSPLLPWQDSTAKAAAAVAPGGTLLIVGHHPHGLAPWGHHHEPGMFYAPDELAESLGLEQGPWLIDVLEARERTIDDPDGNPATILDTVLRATKKA
ncbi:SAM-dependent methyltransferase [Paenarthrobacter sp. NPDC090522]|uniref:SAM-dependent methyltransferase n=1 Tax=Paenarthrobacter sp. NPDC090522 TaxID=3364383 RepID=UPI00380B48A8